MSFLFPCQEAVRTHQDLTTNYSSKNCSSRSPIKGKHVHSNGIESNCKDNSSKVRKDDDDDDGNVLVSFKII